MYQIRNLLSLSLLLVLLAPSLSTDPPSDNGRSKESKYDLDAFQKLLSQVDPPSLHAALHDFSPKKFKHGMFPEDRTAVEAIHREEPGLATGIVKMAKLSKRQSNGTQTTTSSQQSPEPSPSRVTPVPQDSESSTAPLTESSSASTPDSLTSSSTPDTTSAPASSSSDEASSSLTDGQVITTTNSVGLVVVSTVGGGATTISSSRSSSPTSTRARSSLTSTLIQTSTLPDGGRSTITAITVVGAGNEAADTPTGTAGVGSSGTGSGQPSLQTGEAVMTRGCGREMAVVLGAAVGVAFML